MSRLVRICCIIGMEPTIQPAWGTMRRLNHQTSIRNKNRLTLLIRTKPTWGTMLRLVRIRCVISSADCLARACPGPCAKCGGVHPCRSHHLDPGKTKELPIANGIAPDRAPSSASACSWGNARRTSVTGSTGCVDTTNYIVTARVAAPFS